MLHDVLGNFHGRHHDALGYFKTVEITNVKHNSFINSKGYMFRPQTVIIRPYNNYSHLVLCTYWDPIMFALKCIKISK
jgi:hypothetical protein